MYDYLLKNGFVVDGTGAPWFYADVAVKDGRIAEICRNIPASSADRVIDVRGHVVAPGFFDMHAHSEMVYFSFPRAEAKIMQGVTTEFNCQCGSSCFPLRGLAVRQVRRRVGGDFQVDWTDLEGYARRLEAQGVSINSATQVGFGTVRIGVMGYENRAPTRDELDEMKAMVADGMEQGAFGMSTGLMYTPQNFAETDEIIELAKVVARYGGVHTSHDRRRGFQKDPRGGRAFLVPCTDTLIEGVRECIRIGEEAGIPTVWSHAKVPGKQNWGRNLARVLQEIEDARRRGVDVRIDQYPWTSRGADGPNGVQPPNWAEEGGTERYVERLKDPQTRKRIRADIESRREEDWEDVLILSVRKEENKDLAGKTLAEAAKVRGKDPMDLAFDLTIEGERFTATAFSMSEEDVQTIIKHPLTMVSTDGVAGADQEGHPRSYGSYPRILRKYVREERILTLEEAVRKMTSASAAHLGIWDRGILRPGMWADITVFDPLNVKELATYTDPNEYPVGIPYVFVNGKLTVENGVHTGALAGRVLRHAFHRQ